MNLPKTEHDKADQLMRDGEFAEAFKVFNNMIAKNPTDYRAWSGIGMYMMMTSQLHEAKENFEFIIKQDPTNPIGWYGLSMSLSFMGLKLEACRAVDEAAKIIPNNPSVQLSRAVLYAELGATPAQILECFNVGAPCLQTR